MEYESFGIEKWIGVKVKGAFEGNMYTFLASVNVGRNPKHNHLLQSDVELHAIEQVFPDGSIRGVGQSDPIWLRNRSIIQHIIHEVLAGRYVSDET